MISRTETFDESRCCVLNSLKCCNSGRWYSGEHRVAIVESVQNKGRHKSGGDLRAKNGPQFLQLPEMVEREPRCWSDGRHV